MASDGFSVTGCDSTSEVSADAEWLSDGRSSDAGTPNRYGGSVKDSSSPPLVARSSGSLLLDIKPRSLFSSPPSSHNVGVVQRRRVSSYELSREDSLNSPRGRLVSSGRRRHSCEPAVRREKGEPVARSTFGVAGQKSGKTTNYTSGCGGGKMTKRQKDKMKNAAAMFLDEARRVQTSPASGLDYKEKCPASEQSPEEMCLASEQSSEQTLPHFWPATSVKNSRDKNENWLPFQPSSAGTQPSFGTLQMPAPNSNEPATCPASSTSLSVRGARPIEGPNHQTALAPAQRTVLAPTSKELSTCQTNDIIFPFQCLRPAEDPNHQASAAGPPQMQAPNCNEPETYQINSLLRPVRDVQPASNHRAAATAAATPQTSAGALDINEPLITTGQFGYEVVGRARSTQVPTAVKAGLQQFQDVQDDDYEMESAQVQKQLSHLAISSHVKYQHQF